MFATRPYRRRRFSNPRNTFHPAGSRRPSSRRPPNSASGLDFDVFTRLLAMTRNGWQATWSTVAHTRRQVAWLAATTFSGPQRLASRFPSQGPIDFRQYTVRALRANPSWRRGGEPATWRAFPRICAVGNGGSDLDPPQRHWGPCDDPEPRAGQPTTQLAGQPASFRVGG